MANLASGLQQAETAGMKTLTLQTLVLCFNCMPFEHIRENIIDDNYDHEGCEDEYNYDYINDNLILATMTMNTLLGVDCLRKPLE